MRDQCHAEFVLGNPLGDYTLPIVSLVRGHRARAMLERTFGEETTIEEMPRDYFCVSADLVSAEPVVHRRGPLWEALMTSASIPGLLPPRPAGRSCARRRRPSSPRRPRAGRR